MNQEQRFNLSINKLISDVEWAKNKVSDVLFGCALNVMLVNAGICSKLICDMSTDDLTEYVSLIDGIHAAK